MSLCTKVGLFAGSASALLTGVSFAGGTPSDTDARIAALEKQLTELKQESGANWLTESRNEEIRALIQEVMVDSSRRTSLMGNGGRAGYDGGMYFEDANGDTRVDIWGQSQIRYVYNNLDADDTGADESRSGFENRRTKIGFKGHLFAKELKFAVNGAFDRDGGAFLLEDAYGQWVFENGWNFQFGQYKPGYLWEETASSKYFLAAERSYVNELTTIGRTQGVAMNYSDADDQFRFQFGFNDGHMPSPTGPNGESSNIPALAYDTEYSFNARADVKLEGDSWNYFKDYTAPQGQDMAARIGGGVIFESGEYGTAATETETFGFTIDGQVEQNGWNLFASFTGQTYDFNTPGASDYDQFGFVVQGGYRVTEKMEPFARYEWFDFDDALSDAFGSAYGDDLNIITVGVNYYFHEHDWKWTTDVVWALDPIPVGSSGLGLRSDATGDAEDQIALRTQMQFLF